MTSLYYTSFPGVTDLLPKNCLCEDSPEEFQMRDSENFDHDIYDLDDLEEVFTDHLLMSKRLRKTLYAGDFDELKDFPDHPPIALTGLALELFSKAAPNYGLDILDMDYISSTSEAIRISPCAMIVAMIYLERLQMKNSDYLESVSPSGLFVVTMLVASKFLFENEEDIVSNPLWAEALNIDVKELNCLEQEFLSAIDWRLLVDSSDYFDYLCRIEKIIAVRQSSLRGWLSYSDVYTIIQDVAFQHFWLPCFKRIVKVTVLWTLGYVAASFALYGSGIILQRYIKELKYVSQDSLVKHNKLEFYVPVHNAVKLQASSQQSSDFQLVESSSSGIHNLNFKLTVQSEQQAIGHEDKVFSYVCSLLHFRRSEISILKKLPTESQLSNRLKSNYSPPYLDTVAKNKLVYINHMFYSNVQWLQINRQNNCTFVLIR